SRNRAISSAYLRSTSATEISLPRSCSSCNSRIEASARSFLTRCSVKVRDSFGTLYFDRDTSHNGEFGCRLWRCSGNVLGSTLLATLDYIRRPTGVRIAAMKGFAVCAFLASLGSTFGQPAPDGPRFEVASIRASDPNPLNPLFVGMSADGAIVN